MNVSYRSLALLLASVLAVSCAMRRPAVTAPRVFIDHGEWKAEQISKSKWIVSAIDQRAEDAAVKELCRKAYCVLPPTPAGHFVVLEVHAK